MDEADFGILYALDKNARTPLGELGSMLRLSKASVARRISILEKQNFIKGYYAVIDSSLMGYMSFRVYVKFNNASPAIEKRFIGKLLADKRIWFIGMIQGGWDVGFVAWVKSLNEFNNLWFDLFNENRKHVGKYLVTPYSGLLHYALDYLNGGKNKTLLGVIGKSAYAIQLDRKDEAILRTISNNSRLPLTQIAVKTRLTPAIVKNRLNQLKKNGVIRCLRADVNATKLGYSLYKVDFFIEDLNKIGGLRKFLERFPQLVYIDETIGGADLEADFHFKNPQEFEATLEEIKYAYSKTIREYEYFVYSNVLKYSYFPG